jgi:iron(III) transport system permease protein
VVWIAFHPTENIWPHLMATVLPRYLTTTLVLMAGVAVLTAAIGTGAAWLVGCTDFPGRRWLVHALLFPLAIPAYVGAYALVDLTRLFRAAANRAARWPSAGKARATTGSPRCARTWAAVLVLSAALYPYVYLLARQAFAEQSGAHL